MIELFETLEDGNKYILGRYDSMVEFETACYMPFNKQANRDGEGMSNGERQMGGYGNSEEWYGLPRHPQGLPWTWHNTTAWLLDGWAEGVSKMEDAMEKVIPPKARDVRRKQVWHDQGDELNRDRLYGGHYDTAWRTTRRRVTQAPPKIRIVVDVTANCGIATERMIWRGVAATAISQALTKAGYMVEVIASSTIDSFGRGASWSHLCHAVHIVKVKEFGVPLNVASLVAVTAHPAMFRQGFLMQAARQNPWVTTGGMGYCHRTLQQVPESALVKLGLDTKTKTLYVPNTVLDINAAQKWVKDGIAEVEALLFNVERN